MADGRVLRVLDTGAANGQPVVVFHGTPASRRLHEVWVTAAHGVNSDSVLRFIFWRDDVPHLAGQLGAAWNHSEPLLHSA